ncbi:MAG: 2Fe-2S iron-sulfur cluster-binding protein [Ruminococcus sp.]
MFKVTFSFEDGSVVEHFANAGDNLLELAREANVAIDAPCSGNASCGKCRVQLKKGELDSKKTLHISEEEYQEGWRLACTSKICADVTVLVPDIASAYKSRMKVADLSSKEEIAIFENSKRDVEMTGIELRNSLDVIELDMNEPSLDDTMPDNERLTRALKKYMNLKQVRIPYAVLRKLPDVLRENHFKVKCVVRTAPNDLFCIRYFRKR